ncbi:MAG: cupin domain-containing protein, partial [Gammaproteobacteria bacterium]
PANTRIEAHSHPDDRIATVVSGTWHFGYGEAFDEGKLKALPRGSFYTEPPNLAHLRAPAMSQSPFRSPASHRLARVTSDNGAPIDLSVRCDRMRAA